VSANPITAFQIVLQMIHRLVALAILAGVGFAAWWSWRNLGKNSSVSKLSVGWFGLIVVQSLLGAATIWSGKAADVATAHVMAGAASLAIGAIGTLLCFQTRNVPTRSCGSTQFLEIPSPSIPAATAQPAAAHS